MAILELKDAVIHQGNTVILRDVNLELQEGEMAYLIGKTGTGKSSLLKTLYGELPLKEGYGKLVDFDLKGLTWKNVPILRRNIGIVFQSFQLLNDRTVQANLEFVLKATGWKDKKAIQENIDRVLAEVGLEGKGYRMPYEMSGGEQQRVDIARAMLNSPKLILADEPTGNLDPDTTDNIMQVLFKVSKEHNAALLMATHDYRIIQRFPARILRVHDGKLSDVSDQILTLDSSIVE